jgi:hypothetical protein
MSPILYRGVWPQNVSKLAKYAVRFVDGAWKATVIYETDRGTVDLACEGDGTELARLVNSVKLAVRDQPGGPFYINEYRHVIVPVRSDSRGTGSHYYCAGRVSNEVRFEYEGKLITTKPVRDDGSYLKAGDRWIGPRPGIPYVLAAGDRGIYYKGPTLTTDDPPSVRPYSTTTVNLADVITNPRALEKAVRAIREIRGYQGGRFYVNEHGAMFTPVSAVNENGLDYIYCGQVDYDAWFPEPRI